MTETRNFSDFKDFRNFKQVKGLNIRKLGSNLAWGRGGGGIGKNPFESV
jgi:hypothetical protein